MAHHIQHDPETKNTTGTTLDLFYENQMSDSYKTDERVLRDIINRNCEPVHPTDNLKLTVFYRSPKVSCLVMKNNLSKDPSPVKETNVVYQYKCTHGDCARQHNCTYIGHTTTTLGRRITMHLQEGGPKKHLADKHGTRLTRRDMVANTVIIGRCNDRRRLQALEAVYIRDCDPLINRQVNARGTLSLFDGAPLGARV